MKKLIFALVSILLSGTIHSQPVESNNGINHGYISSIAMNSTTGVIYAGTVGRGMYKSSDNGETWNMINNGLAGYDLYISYVAVSHGNIVICSDENVFLSTDEGASWSKKMNGLQLSGDHPPVMFLVSNGDYFYAGKGRNLFRMRYDETAWSNIITGITEDFSAGSIAFSGSKIFLGTDEHGVYYSPDNGATWTPARNGLGNGSGSYLWIEQLETNGTNVFAATSGGVYISSNNGTTWSLPSNLGFPDADIITMASSGTTIFAGTEESGLFRTTNNGTSWTVCYSGMPVTNTNDILVNGTQLIAASYGGVYFSNDNGDNWTVKKNGLRNFWISSIAVDGSNIYGAAVLSGIYHSADVGTSWALKNSGMMTPYYTYVAAAGSKVIAGVEEGGIYMSTDNGNNWNSSNNGLPDMNIHSVATDGTNFFAGTRYGVYYTNDPAGPWTARNSGIADLYIDCMALKGSKLFAGGYSDFYMSPDNGLTWTQVPDITSVRSVLINGTDVFAFSYNGVYRSTNDGASWTLVSNWTGDITSTCASGSLLFAGTYKGLYASTNRGVTWAAVEGYQEQEIGSVAISGGYLISGLNYWGFWKQQLSDIKILDVSVKSLTFERPASGTLSFNIKSNTAWTVTCLESWLSSDFPSGTGDKTITLTATENKDESQREAVVKVSAAGVADRLIKVIQNGLNFWYEANNGMHGSIPLNVTSFAQDPGTGYMYMGGNEFIYRSTDQGQTWSDVNTSQIKDLSSLAVFGGKIFAGTGVSGIFISENNGESWTSSVNGISATLYIRDFEYTSAGIFAATADGVFLSPDGGMTWTQKNNGIMNQRINDIYIDGSKMYLATAGGGVFVSADYGNSWNSINSGLTGNALNVTSIVRSGSRLLCATSAKVYVSDDEGASWSLSSTGISYSSVNSLANLYGRLYAVSYGGVYTSEDNGATWTQTAGSPSGTKLLYDGNVMYMWGGGGLFISSGYDDWWYPMTSDINGSGINTLARNGASILAGTNGNGIFVSADNGSTWTQNYCMYSVRTIILSGSRMYAAGSEGVKYADSDYSIWTPVNNGLPGLNLTGMAETDSKLFACSANGVFRSENQGASWTAVNNGLATTSAKSVRQIVAKGSVLLIINNDGLYRSANYGDSWVRVPELPASYNTLTVIEGRIFVAAGTLLVSEDDGLTWTSVGTGLPTNILSITKSGTDYFIGSSGGVYISHDDLKNWRPINSGLRSYTTASMLSTDEYIFAGTRYSGVWRQKKADLCFMSAVPDQIKISNTAGSPGHIDVFANSAWTLQSSESWLVPGATSGSGNLGITLSAEANNTHLPREAVVTLTGKGAGNKQVIVAQNGISGWEEINNGVYNGDINDLVTDASTGKIYAATKGGGLFTSSNNGDLWTPVGKGLIDKDITAVAIKGNTIIAGSYAAGVFVSHDNGLSFATGIPGMTGLQVTDIEVTASGIFLSTNSGGIFLSTDDGNIWTRVNTGPSELVMRVYSLLYVDGTLYAGTLLGVCKTVNNGASWTASSTGLPSNTSITALASDGTNLYAGCSLGVYKSTDNGSNWALASSGLAGNTLRINRLFAVSSSLYAATTGGIVVTNDGGVSWTAPSALVSNNIKSIASRDGFLFAGSGYGVLRSSDSGVNWIGKNEELTNAMITGIASAGERLFASYLHGILKSDDNGLNWSAVTTLPAESASSVYSAGNYVFANMTTGMYRSSDYGQTWTLNTLSSVSCLVLKESKLYAGTNGGGVFVSEDGGINWTPINNGLVFYSLRVSAMAFRGDDLYIGTSANGVFVLKSSSSSWQPVSTGLTRNALYIYSLAIKDNTIFAGTLNGVFRSEDGLIWTAANRNISEKTIASLTLSGNRLFATTGSGIFFSDDNAATWAPMNDGLDIHQLNSRKSILYEGYLYAGTSYNGIWRHLLTEKYLYTSSLVLTIDQEANSTGAFDITSNTDWNISCPESWITILPVSGLNNSGILLTAQANPSTAERTAIITITGTGIQPVTVTVTQQGLPLDVRKEEIQRILVYPVPAEDILWIKGLPADAAVSVYDMKGRLIKTSQITEDQLDIKGLPSGAYLLRIEINSKTFTRRFIKQ